MHVLDHGAELAVRLPRDPGLSLQRLELVAQVPHLPDAPVQVGDLAVEDLADVAARALAPVAEGDDLLDLVEAEAEALRRLDEGEPVGVGLLVAAVPRWRAGRLREQADRLVEANGLGGDPEALGQLPNAHGATLPAGGRSCGSAASLDLPLEGKVYVALGAEHGRAGHGRSSFRDRQAPRRDLQRRLQDLPAHHRAAPGADRLAPRDRGPRHARRQGRGGAGRRIRHPHGARRGGRRVPARLLQEQGTDAARAPSRRPGQARPAPARVLVGVPVVSFSAVRGAGASRLWPVLAVLTFSLSSCGGSSPTRAPIGPAVQHKQLDVDGGYRRYRLYTPP